MAIQIGNRTPIYNNLTNKERLFLSSDTQSNLVILQSKAQSTNILINNVLIGSSNDNLMIVHSNINVASFNSNSIQFKEATLILE